MIAGGTSLLARILQCPDCHSGIDTNLLCCSCGRSFAPEIDGIINALPASMQRVVKDKDELRKTVETIGAGEHGENVVLYEKAFHDEQAPYYDHLFADPLPLGKYYRHLVRNQIHSFVREVPFVVDLCCGTGKSSMPLAERGMLVVAMDVSREMLRVYAKKSAARGLNSVVLIHADASNPPLTPASCGAISMIGGLHHIRDQEGSLKTCCEALQSGGFLVLHEPLQTGSKSRWAGAVENLYAVTDPARLWRAVMRRLGLVGGTLSPAFPAPVPDFTPYEKPFTSAGELLAIMPGSMKPLALRSQGLLSFREFAPHLQNRMGVPFAALIVRLDDWLSRARKAQWSGDAIFAVFRKAA